MGPILPQTNVFGKQLGIAPDVMGLITSVLPIMYILAKPAVGYLIDSFSNARKAIFIAILLVMTLCYAGFHFVPLAQPHAVPLHDRYTFEMGRVPMCRGDPTAIGSAASLCHDYRPVRCAVECLHAATPAREYDGLLSVYKRAFVVVASDPSTNEESVEDLALPMLAGTTTTTTPVPDENTDSINPKGINNTDSDNHPSAVFSSNLNYELCLRAGAEHAVELIGNKSCSIDCRVDAERQPDCVLGTATLWWFVCLMCVGTIGFNVANCVSDATCFDMLGEFGVCERCAGRNSKNIKRNFIALVIRSI